MQQYHKTEFSPPAIQFENDAWLNKKVKTPFVLLDPFTDTTSQMAMVLQRKLSQLGQHFAQRVDKIVERGVKERRRQSQYGTLGHNVYRKRPTRYWCKTHFLLWLYVWAAFASKNILQDLDPKYYRLNFQQYRFWVAHLFWPILPTEPVVIYCYYCLLLLLLLLLLGHRVSKLFLTWVRAALVSKCYIYV